MVGDIMIVIKCVCNNMFYIYRLTNAALGLKKESRRYISLEGCLYSPDKLLNSIAGS